MRRRRHFMMSFTRPAILLSCLWMSGCQYPLGDWQDKRTVDAPWVAPHKKAIWQERIYQWAMIPAAEHRKRWVDADHKFIMTDYPDLERYLSTTLEWKQWK